MGSVPEGTRIGVANEMDVCIDFEGLADSMFGVKLGDPYHLFLTESLPEWMAIYFDSNQTFMLAKFKLDLLQAVDLAVTEALQEIETNLCTFKQNFNYKFQECDECVQNMDASSKTALFKQCRGCKVLTSQNKVGICLQLGWRCEGFCYQGGNSIYSSGFVSLFNSQTRDAIGK